MTTEKQRILIAEACGWTDGGGVSNWPHYGYRKGAGKPESPEPLPDYLSDLNAMHEAEKVLTGYLRAEYTCALRRIIVRDMDVPANQNPDTSTLLDIYFYGATAAQRAEAFLRTLGKWEES